MKKLFFTTIVAAATAVSHGQGSIFVDNSGNTGVYDGAGGTVANPVYSPLVTANGLIFTTDPTEQEQNLGGRAGSMLIGVDFSWAIYGGATEAAVLAAIQSGTPLASNTGSGIVGDNPQFGVVEGQPPVPILVPGSTAGGYVYLDLFVWEGSTYPTFGAALAALDYVGDTDIFLNPTGGQGIPPQAGAYLTGMPDILLGGVPEPGTLALAALGGAALLLFRRKK